MRGIVRQEILHWMRETAWSDPAGSASGRISGPAARLLLAVEKLAIAEGRIVISNQSGAMPFSY